MEPHHHARSGLWRWVLEEGVPIAEAEARTLATSCDDWVPANAYSPMCGNSICQDRRFHCTGGCSLETHSITATST